MNAMIRLLYSTIIILLATTIACIATDGIDLSPLDEAIVSELNSANTPGCAVAVVSGDKMIYAKAFGVANLETGQPLELDALFNIGSTTKMFTAYTLLSLAEYVGTYTTTSGTVYGVKAADGNLSLSQGGKLLPGQHEMEWPLFKLSNNDEFG
jgi:hypothetical protein